MLQSITTDGICFYCGTFSDSLEEHEKVVHGKRDEQQQLY